jgi:hypothetical protein
MAEGPLYTAFLMDTTGVLRQTLITYRVKDNNLCRETVERVFTPDGTDYVDSTNYTPLGAANVTS